MTSELIIREVSGNEDKASIRSQISVKKSIQNNL